MKISIVTAAYNSGATLRDTMESVLRQTYKDIEYIVVDGGSGDDTMDIVREYEPLFGGRMRYVSEPDRGIYDAMNKGIGMATGDVVGMLNSDDLFFDDYVVNDIANSFSEEVDAVCGNLYFVKENDIDFIVRAWKGSPYKSFKKGWHPAHPTFYVRREVYEKYGLFDISFDVSADFELMLRFIEKYKIKVRYVERYMVKMRIGGESTGNIKNIIKGNRNVLRAFNKNGIKVSPFYLLFRLVPKAVGMIKYKLFGSHSA